VVWPPRPRQPAATTPATFSEWDRLIAIIDPRNWPSQRVAEKLGLAVERDSDNHGRWHSLQRIYAVSLPQG
jgi:RimJ/RimL family protein N-acetyltransferase